MKTRSILLFFGLLSIAFGLRLHAAEAPSIALSTDVEDGRKMLVATVTTAGKPVENARVSFFARRTFGSLVLGSEETLDDGTAAVAFPTTLPGDDRGRLRIGAELASSPKGAGSVRAEAVFDGGLRFVVRSGDFPRALWAPRAPLILIAAIAVLVGLVWSAFAYVVFQLKCIRTETAPSEIPVGNLTTGQSVFLEPKTSL